MNWQAYDRLTYVGFTGRVALVLALAGYDVIGWAPVVDVSAVAS